MFFIKLIFCVAWTAAILYWMHPPKAADVSIFWFVSCFLGAMGALLWH